MFTLESLSLLSALSRVMQSESIVVAFSAEVRVGDFEELNCW